MTVGVWGAAEGLRGTVLHEATDKARRPRSRRRIGEGIGRVTVAAIRVRASWQAKEFRW